MSSMRAPLLRHCSDIVSAGREKWLWGPDKKSGMENACWYRFVGDHLAGPVFHNGEVLLVRAAATCSAAAAAWRTRTDALFCSAACKQRAYRRRQAVTQA